MQRFVHFIGDNALAKVPGSSPRSGGQTWRREVLCSAIKLQKVDTIKTRN